MSWCETERKKKCAIGEQDVIKLEDFILGRQVRREIKDEERGWRKGVERG